MSVELLDRGGEVVEFEMPQQVLVEGESDARGVPLAAEVPLSALAPGEYTLRLKVTDIVKNESAAQQVTFGVE